MLIERNDVPKHLFGILELDLSGDPCAERMAGPWFRLGAWTLGSGSEGQGMENVVYRQMSHKSASTLETARLDTWFGFPERGCRSL